MDLPLNEKNDVKQHWKISRSTLSHCMSWLALSKESPRGYTKVLDFSLGAILAQENTGGKENAL